MTIVLIGNYLPDRQESMERFTQMLCSGIQKAGYKCIIWRPKSVVGSYFKSNIQGIGRWAGYIDKWIIFPLILKWRIQTWNDKTHLYSFHICDHSNAPYLNYLPYEKTVITCHDVLAIMGALGYKNTFCEASRLGKILQNWILKHLSSAKNLAADSQQTLKQLQDLVPNKIHSAKVWEVIHIGFNNDFKPNQTPSALEKLNNLRLGGISYILHVGSGLPRKNRKLLIDMAVKLGNKWNGKICYAGEDVEPCLLNYAVSLGLKDRIVIIVKPNHEILTMLYSSCDAFIFPSYSEGFGWPLIEAQACGAPVIASNVEPMPEISNGTALHCDPNSPQDFADAYLWLQDKNNRSDLVKAGFENIIRFDVNKMTIAYLELHGLKPLK